MHKNRISVHIIFALLEKDCRLEVLHYFAIIITHKTLIISFAFIHCGSNHKRDITEPASRSLYSHTPDSKPEG